MPPFSVLVAWHLIHSDRKKWLQNTCSIFCWMLTAGSGAFHSWPCEILSCLCNAIYIKYTHCSKASAACTRIYFWKQMFRSVSPMPFLLYYSMAWEMPDTFSYILNMIQRSHNTDLFHENPSCSIVLRKYLQAVKPAINSISNHIYRILFLLLCVHHKSIRALVPLYKYVYVLMVFYLSWKSIYLKIVNLSKFVRLWA